MDDIITVPGILDKMKCTSAVRAAASVAMDVDQGPQDVTSSGGTKEHFDHGPLDVTLYGGTKEHVDQEPLGVTSSGGNSGGHAASLIDPSADYKAVQMQIEVVQQMLVHFRQAFEQAHRYAPAPVLSSGTRT
eukprot:4426226-Amphidinium_carterae.1